MRELTPKFLIEYQYEEDRQNALRVGMNGHIAKPIRVEKLLALLAKILKK